MRKKLVLLTSMSSPWSFQILSAFLRHADVRLVITQPNRPKAPLASFTDAFVNTEPSRQICEQHQVPFLYNQDANTEDCIRKILSCAPDAVISFGYGQIYHDAIITALSGLFYNIHPSFLPDHKGANPFMSVLWEKESSSGFSMHHIARAIDAGAVVYQETFPVYPADTALDLMFRLGERCAAAVPEMLQHLGQKGTLLDGGRYFKKYPAEIFALRKDDSPEVINLKWRTAFQGYWLHVPLGDCSLIVKQYSIAEPGIFAELPAGTIAEVNDYGFSIAMNGFLLRVHDWDIPSSAPRETVRMFFKHHIVPNKELLA